MAVDLQRSDDWLAARRSDQCANHRCAVGLLTAIAAREFRLLKLILHSELRPRAASCRALPCTSSYSFFCRSAANVTVKKIQSVHICQQQLRVAVGPGNAHFIFIRQVS